MLRDSRTIRPVQSAVVPMAVTMLIVLLSAAGLAQQPPPGGILLDSGSAIGGVFVDAEGVLNQVDARQAERLRGELREALRAAPQDLNQKVALRTVSLRQLVETIRQHRQTSPDAPLPQEVALLAGLERVQYVFVVPEAKDVLLAGPADGWKVNDRGTIVAATSGLPVLHLEDLIVALRVASSAERRPISVSIEPTAEGVQRLSQYLARQRQFSPAVKQGMEQSLGRQMILLSGVPGDSRFAKVLVAADYRMKRYGMGLDESPVPGMPSYLALLQSSQGAIPTDISPRWWMEADYQPLLTDDQGLAWELRPGIKVLTEDERRDDQGRPIGTRRAHPLATKWAETMTAKYDELAAKDPVFAELRNCIDLAVVAALIRHERLDERAGLDLGYLLDAERLPAGGFTAPREVDTLVSLADRRRGTRQEWILTASGGVIFSPWQIAERRETSAALGKMRSESKIADGQWYGQ
jgi:hypothetical protein